MRSAPYHNTRNLAGTQKFLCYVKVLLYPLLCLMLLYPLLCLIHAIGLHQYFRSASTSVTMYDSVSTTNQQRHHGVKLKFAEDLQAQLVSKSSWETWGGEKNTHTHTHTHMHAHARARVHTHHTHTHAYTRTHARVHTHTPHTHTHMHAHTHLNLCSKQQIHSVSGHCQTWDLLSEARDQQEHMLVTGKYNEQGGAAVTWHYRQTCYKQWVTGDLFATKYRAFHNVLRDYKHL